MGNVEPGTHNVCVWGGGGWNERGVGRRKVVSLDCFTFGSTWS